MYFQGFSTKKKTKIEERGSYVTFVDTSPPPTQFPIELKISGPSHAAVPVCRGGGTVGAQCTNAPSFCESDLRFHSLCIR